MREPDSGMAIPLHYGTARLPVQLVEKLLPPLPPAKPCKLCKSEDEGGTVYVTPTRGLLELSSGSIPAAVFECGLCGGKRIEPLVGGLR